MAVNLESAMIELPPKTWDEDIPGQNEQAQQLRWIILSIEEIVAHLNEKELQTIGEI